MIQNNIEQSTQPLSVTTAAAEKVKQLITEENNYKLRLRVYIVGGGCAGFQYGFAFDEKQNEDDTIVSKNGMGVIVDSMSLQYFSANKILALSRSG